MFFHVTMVSVLVNWSFWGRMTLVDSGFRFQFRSFARITGTLLLEAMVDSNGGMVNDRKLITKYNNRSESAFNDHHMIAWLQQIGFKQKTNNHPSSQGLQTTLCRLPTWKDKIQVFSYFFRLCHLFDVDTVPTESSVTELAIVAWLDETSALCATLHLWHQIKPNQVRISQITPNQNI